MTDKELKELKDTLWHSADVLRASAHLAANKYGQPILGLIFLRYADILYKQHKEEIEAEYNRLKGGRMEKSLKEISIEKCGFYLPECAYYDFLNDAPDDANKATLVKKAMEAIEDENPKMDGVLPKEVYAQLVPEEEPELLSNIVRIFKDIPENSTIDIFGEIYEYFLGNFALAEGKDGGTFYTPATVVRFTIITLFMSILSLIVACLIGKDSNCIFYDISMALLGSAVLGFIMSLTEYYVEKRKAMEEFWLQSSKILKELRKIKYLELDAPIELIKDALLEEQTNDWTAKFPLCIDDSGITHKAKNALISWFEENIPMSFNEDSDIEAELEKYYNASLKNYKDTFLRCMKSYQDASSIDLGMIDNAYGNLDFIISNRSIRLCAYNKIFDKMRKFVYQFIEEAYHFNLLNDGKGNFAVCASKVVDLNKLFFTAKDVEVHGYVNTLVYQTAFDEIESELEKFRCKIYKTKYVPVKASPISGIIRYFEEDSETKGTDE